MTNTRRVGRRPGDPAATKATILASALRVFASAGYHRATIRSIAEEAAVDPALVVHHFGSKEALFRAAHEIGAGPGSGIPASTDPSGADHAETITRNCLLRYAAQGTVEQSLLKSAMTHLPAADLLFEVISRDTLAIAHALRADGAVDEAVELVQSLLLGAAVACQLEQPRSVAGACVDSKVTGVLSAIRRCVTDHGLP